MGPSSLKGEDRVLSFVTYPFVLDLLNDDGYLVGNFSSYRDLWLNHGSRAIYAGN